MEVNYELQISLKVILAPDNIHAHRIGFYAISFVSVHFQKVSADT